MSQVTMLESKETTIVRTHTVNGPWRDAWRRLLRQKSAVAGGIIILIFIFAAVFAPFITFHPWDGKDLYNRLHPMSSENWFGTDDLGRDVFTRVIFGARISLWVGFFAIAGSVVVGSLLGILSGFYGRWLDMLISRIFDIMLAFPSILLAIAIVAILGPSLENAILAIAIVNIPTFGRLVRSTVLSIKEEEYIMAARAQGMKDTRIIFQHILPNSMAPIIVQASLGIATAILEAAALGFLGLGAQPPEPEWGKMLADSKDYIQKAPWTVIFPGLCIMLTVLGFNLMGDGLRDALDPKMKQ